MSQLLQYMDNIDSLRLRRAKELSDIKVRFASSSGRPNFNIESKATIVLAYAHWEGFYNECVECFIGYQKETRRKVRDVAWPLLIGLLTGEFQQLNDRNHSLDSETEFIERLEPLIEQDFNGFNVKVICSRSNLNFKKLQQNFRILGFDLSPLQPLRLRIDNELVAWRHGVAHGDEPDLLTVDLISHVEFTQELLLTMADIFQNHIVDE